MLLKIPKVFSELVILRVPPVTLIPPAKVPTPALTLIPSDAVKVELILTLLLNVAAVPVII